MVEINQLSGIVAGITLFVSIALYIYTSLALMTIAKKTNTPNAWLAWIPIANLYLMMEIAGARWWTLLVVLFGWLIPFVGALLGIAVILTWWHGIAKARNKPGWLGLLMIIPIVNLVILGYLAWSE